MDSLFFSTGFYFSVGIASPLAPELAAPPIYSGYQNDSSLSAFSCEEFILLSSSDEFLESSISIFNEF
jgi:hypothetical protein